MDKTYVTTMTGKLKAVNVELGLSSPLNPIVIPVGARVSDVHRATTVLVIGDEPSKKNKITGVPFYGTRSFERIVSWFQCSRISHFAMVNSIDKELLVKSLEWAYKEGIPVFTLGYKAYSRSKYFKPVFDPYLLPHPSGRNRKLNDELYERKVINLVRMVISVRTGLAYEPMGEFWND